MTPNLSMLLMTLSIWGFAAHSIATPPRVVSIPFARKNDLTRLVKRDAFPVTLDNYVPADAYYAIASVGTPPQSVGLLIDTGSSDTWMFAPDTCHGHFIGPCLGGSFDPSKSSTFKHLSQLGKFKIQYADSEKVRGVYISDNFALGGEQVSGLTMGLAQKSGRLARNGIIGLGLDVNEADEKRLKHPYPNLPDALFEQGLIPSKSYSLYLDDFKERTGTLLFGGYDTEKFSGELVMLPIQKDQFSGIRSSFTVSLTGFGTSFQGRMASFTADGFPYPVLLDSGTPLIYLPTILFEPFRKLFKLHCSFGLCLVDCDIKKFLGEGTFDFSFGDTAKISIPVEALATPFYSFRGHLVERGRCAFNILPQPPNFGLILGQAFLQSAYVLYDLENRFIGLAQAKLGVNKSNIVEYAPKGRAKSITTDLMEPTALETTVASYSYSFISTHLLPSAPVVRPTYVKPIPSAFRYVPLPSGIQPVKMPSLLASVTTPASGHGHGNSGGSRTGRVSGSSRGGGSSVTGGVKGPGSSGSHNNFQNGARARGFEASIGILTAGVVVATLLGAVIVL